jgi:hypothetical protein
MPLNIPAGFGQLAYRFALSTDPEPMIVTFGINVNFGSTGGQAKANSKADAFIAALPASSIVSGYRFLGCTIREGNGEGESIVWDAPRIHVGTAATATLPNNCAYLVKKNTATAGRRHRGRLYLPCLVGEESQVGANGALLGTLQADLQAAVGVMFPGDDYVILHSAPPGVAVPPPTVVTSLTVDGRIATQRRRMRG